MKVVHLTSVHNAVDTRILHKECRTLAEAGYEVVLVAPHGRDENVSGVHIKSVPLPRNRTQRVLKTIWQVYGAALRENAAVYHIHDPELISIGVLLKLGGKSVVYDVHEDFPKDVLNKSYLPRVTRPGLSQLVESSEGLAATMFDAIVAATPVIARRFPSDKTIVVQNFALLDEWKAIDAVPYPQRSAIATYAGSITELRGVRELLGAVALLPERLSATLSLAGTFGSPELEQDCRQSPGWARVDFQGWRSRQDLSVIFGSSRVGLVVLHPTPTYLESQPTKLYEYMSARLPVIASSFPVWRDLIEGHRCGLTVDPFDCKAIAGAIEWILDHPSEAEAMGTRGRVAVKEHYCWDVEATKLLSLYERILVGKTTGRA